MKATRDRINTVGSVIQATPEQWGLLVKVVGPDMAEVPVLTLIPTFKGGTKGGGILILNPKHGFAGN